jgi:hypothetical protein
MMMLAHVRLQVNDKTCCKEGCSIGDVHAGVVELWNNVLAMQS